MSTEAPYLDFNIFHSQAGKLFDSFSGNANHSRLFNINKVNSMVCWICLFYICIHSKQVYVRKRDRFECIEEIQSIKNDQFLIPPPQLQ